MLVAYTTITEIQDRNIPSEILSVKSHKISNSYKNRYSDLTTSIENTSLIDDNQNTDPSFLANKFRDTYHLTYKQKNEFSEIKDVDTQIDMLKTLRDVGLDIKIKIHGSNITVKDPLLYLYISTADNTLSENKDININRNTLSYIPFLSDSKLFFISLTLSGAIGSLFRHSLNNDSPMHISLIS